MPLGLGSWGVALTPVPLFHTVPSGTVFMRGQMGVAPVEREEDAVPPFLEHITTEAHARA